MSGRKHVEQLIFSCPDISINFCLFVYSSLISERSIKMLRLFHHVSLGAYILFFGNKKKHFITLPRWEWRYNLIFASLLYWHNNAKFHMKSWSSSYKLWFLKRYSFFSYDHMWEGGIILSFFFFGLLFVYCGWVFW